MAKAPRPKLECRASDGIDPLKLCPTVQHQAEVDGAALYDNKYQLMQAAARCWLAHRLLVECVNNFNNPKPGVKEKTK